MTQAANITVKKADGTTDILYTVMTPSAGFNSPALFRSNSVGLSVAERPSFEITPKKRVGRRVVKTAYVYPIVDAVSGKVVDYGTLTCESNVPDSAADAIVNEVVHQGCNLLAAALVKQTRIDGIGPT